MAILGTIVYRDVQGAKRDRQVVEREETLATLQVGVHALVMCVVCVVCLTMHDALTWNCVRLGVDLRVDKPLHVTPVVHIIDIFSNVFHHPD